MTAAQLLAKAAECVTCGQEHKPRPDGFGRTTWAAPDGHAYRTRLLEMTGNGSNNVIAALRQLAGIG